MLLGKQAATSKNARDSIRAPINRAPGEEIFSQTLNALPGVSSYGARGAPFARLAKRWGLPAGLVHKTIANLKSAVTENATA